MIKNRAIALTFRSIALIIAAAGFLDMLGTFSGELRLGTLMFYTMQSNMLAIALFAMLLIRTAIGLRDGKTGSAGYFARFEMICVNNIMLTFLVYWLLLAPILFTMVEEYSMWTFDNLAVHAFTPLLCLLDYILFTQPRHLKYRDIYYICIFPLAYTAATSIAGLLGYVYFISAADGLPVRFPYFFYDFDRIGFLSLAYIGAMVIFFLLAGHVFYYVDRRKKHLEKYFYHYIL